ncbi:hypothetical protein BH10CYA1_BH10CYA1_34310 [soil metagenome]
MVISNAKVTVLAAAFAAAGAILNSTDAPTIIPILWTVACLLGLFFVARKRIAALTLANQSNPSTSRRISAQAILIALILAMSTLGYFEYGQMRNKPASTDLVNFSGRDVIFIATANRADCRAATRELTLNCESLIFPKNQTLSGKTDLTFLAVPDELVKIYSATTSGEQVRLRIRGHVYQPRKDPPPWEYDKRKKLAALGIFSICYLDRKTADSPSLFEVAKPHNASTLAPGIALTPESSPNLSRNYEASMTYARNLIVNTHRKYLPPKLADLLSSMVLGNRAVALSAETTHTFRDVGLSHILAASGFNLTIVTVMSFALCRLVTPSVVLANGACFLCMLGFVSLAGPSPSVIRAALMCTIMLITKSGQRKTQVLSALALAFLLTVTADPLCTSDLGLQLSYAATVGIVLGSKALTTQLYSGKSKWKQALADAIAVVLIAQFSVMPIQVFFFWRAGTMFIPANLLVTPLVTPLTMVGFASSTLALINPPQPAVQAIFSCIIAFADALAFIPLTMMILIVNTFASFDAANFTLGPPSALSIVLYYCCFLLLLISLRISRRAGWASLAFSGTLALLLWRPEPPLLTIANVHSHTVVINSNHQAIDVDTSEAPSKIVERFFAYSGAKVSPRAFSTGVFKSGTRFAHSQKWLLIILSEKVRTIYPSESAGILLTARKLQCEKIIILTSAYYKPSDFLPASEYKAIPQTSDTELKLVGLKNVSAITYIRR